MLRFFIKYFRNYLKLYHSYLDFQEAKLLEICACEILVVVKNSGGGVKIGFAVSYEKNRTWYLKKKSF